MTCCSVWSFSFLFNLSVFTYLRVHSGIRQLSSLPRKSEDSSSASLAVWMKKKIKTKRDCWACEFFVCVLPIFLFIYESYSGWSETCEFPSENLKLVGVFGCKNERSHRYQPRGAATFSVRRAWRGPGESGGRGASIRKQLINRWNIKETHEWRLALIVDSNWQLSTVNFILFWENGRPVENDYKLYQNSSLHIFFSTLPPSLPNVYGGGRACIIVFTWAIEPLSIATLSPRTRSPFLIPQADELQNWSMLFAWNDCSSTHTRTHRKADMTRE